MITASPGGIIAGTASGLLAARAARRLDTSGGGYALLAAAAAGAFAGPGLLTRLPTRSCRPIVVFTAFGRRGLAGLVLAGITALVRGGAGTSTGNAAFAAITRPHAPGSMRGRVFSAFGLIWPSTRLASLLLGGLLAGTAGIRAACHLGGALLAAAALDGLILR